MVSGAKIVRENAGALDRLRQAYNDRSLTLYLGAGVSVANGIPTWEKLVSAMYFAAIEEQPMGSWRPYPNYLFAIAEWHLKRGHEPLDITARKIRNYYPTQEAFLSSLRQTLYAAFAAFWTDNGFQPTVPVQLRAANSTLDSIAGLCENPKKGIRSVITYNYDELLEAVLGDLPFQAIWREQESLDPDRMPIYHVHGYVPRDPGKGSEASELVFTEEQYHLVARDDYSWANLVQLRAMSTSMGLMVGLSGTDRNMRRLLDAVRKVPLRSENFILMKRPSWQSPSPHDLKAIHLSAQEYVDMFERSGIKSSGTKGPDWQDQIAGILKEVEQLAIRQQKGVLEELGVTPIWYDDHADIPTFIAEIMKKRHRSRNSIA